MKIKVQPLNLRRLDYRKLKPIQGGLKFLTERNYKRLKNSFTQKGMFIPMFVWKNGEDFFLLDGHGRERFFQREGTLFVDENGKESHEVPCLLIEAKDLQDAKEKLLIISSQYQTISQEGLDEFSADLDDEWMKETVHFDELIDPIMKVDEAEGENDVPEIPTTPITQRGDLIVLGNHRLICGDATNVLDVKNLLGDVKPHLMVTDPPYGVEYDANWRNEADRADGRRAVGRAVGPVTNDDRVDWREAWALFEGEVAYVWHAGVFASEVAESLKSVGFAIRSQIIWAKPRFAIRSQIIWAKPRFAISRGHYHWQHEPCWYAVRKNGHWEGGRSQTTVWNIEHNKSETGHSTQKPVEAMRRPIMNNSCPGQAVYDPFLGSGTTLIACETSNRICFGLEIDPAYCDVIVSRWETFTGKKAVRHGSFVTIGDDNERQPSPDAGQRQLPIGVRGVLGDEKRKRLPPAPEIG